MDTTNISFKKSASNYGLILGGILAGTTALLYAIYLEMLANFWLGVLLFFVAIGIGIVSVAKSKSILGGFISFKQGFTSYFITIAIGLFCAVLINIVIFNFIDTGAGEFLKEQAIDATRDFLKRIGTPEADINEAMAKAEQEDSFGLLSQLKGYPFQLAFYSLFGLLIALIMKKKDPNSLN